MAMASVDAVERRTREIGRGLLAALGCGPAVWERAWWDDRATALVLSDPLVRVQLFRFLDVIPASRTAIDVRRHLGEYLDEAGAAVPWWLRGVLNAAPLGSWRARGLAAFAARRHAHGAKIHRGRESRRGAGDRAPPSRTRARVHRRLARRSRHQSAREAESYQQTCLDLIRGLAPASPGSRRIR